MTASQLLVCGGFATLAFGLLTGLPIGLIRAKEPTAPKYLMLAHQGAFMWAPILVALVIVLQHCQMSEGLKFLAAASMVAASALLNAKDTWHWLRGTKDEFAEKPIPLYLGHAMTAAYTLSLALIGYGLFRGFVA